ncbi:hypothetical protein RIR_jg37101.t1 [Rhizophagus irregularis DAOM 181602=DAOM 197198]|nr:hypothetical protein RIR_jg37101.t1 [Rhizophagus irregularis DAOM 181602=DAOM 197198]
MNIEDYNHKSTYINAMIGESSALFLLHYKNSLAFKILLSSFQLIEVLCKIDLFTNNGQVIIICMLAEQAKKLIALEWFQIDVSFKRVKEEINEFEINTYDSNHHLILSFCRIFTNVFTAEGYHRLFLSLFQVIYEVSGQHIKNLHNRAFEKNTRQIPNASSKEEVNILLQQIKDTNDDGIEGTIY